MVRRAGLLPGRHEKGFRSTRKPWVRVEGCLIPRDDFALSLWVQDDQAVVRTCPGVTRLRNGRSNPSEELGCRCAVGARSGWCHRFTPSVRTLWRRLSSWPRRPQALRTSSGCFAEAESRGVSSEQAGRWRHTGPSRLLVARGCHGRQLCRSI